MKMRKTTFIMIAVLMLVGAVLLSCANYNTFPDHSWGEELKDPAKLKEIIDNGETAVTVEGDTVTYSQYVIIDVRPTDDYNGGHIPTAINIKNGDVNAYENAGNTAPPKDAYCIVYCETGGRAEQAAKTMHDDYDYLYLLNWGSYKNWGDAGYEYETE